MTDSFMLYSKLECLPENLKAEVSDFIDFLMTKKLPVHENHVPVKGRAKERCQNNFGYFTCSFPFLHRCKQP